ncbi:PTS sugar transporter subunit IIB [Halanaerobium sp. Z-7514]|uniref:PTS sugar transporter subunit IIB n=1 Tax=Halanaerobium polyolivorans TaxID=2886943 RepID=A0AAW4X1P4_9FIRM|nr:PTS sugar transporter subunit IIB [Halanaerobium polyolivorans]MCC3145751.1 PTS sugar transporter subunit IIB [Halanaerobium polyolivorans]
MKKKVLIVCGTGIATSTVVNEKIKNLAKKAGVKVDINQAKVTEAKREIENSNYDFLVTTTAFSYKVDLPVINATAMISGIGEEEVEEKIIAKLKE